MLEFADLRLEIEDIRGGKQKTEAWGAVCRKNFASLAKIGALRAAKVRWNDGVLAKMNAWYEIRVRGQLDASWAEWFEGMQIEHTEQETRLRGRVKDQAALFGILNKLRNLGLELLDVQRDEEGERE